VLFDIALGIPLALSVLLGLRDGIVRKLVGIFAIIIALFVGQLFMRDAAVFLMEKLSIPRSEGPSAGFFAIFMCVTLGISLIYRLLSGNYKIGGLADKILGAMFGAVQGALFVSSLLLILAMQGIPSRESAKGSRLYKHVVNLAPQILDFGSSILPQTQQHLEELTNPRKTIEDGSSKKFEAEKKKKVDEVDKQVHDVTKKLEKSK
jgi:membrane protein required for colicin V production